MGSNIADVIEGMRRAPNCTAFRDLYRVCHYYFGKPTQRGSSYGVFKTPWSGEPRVNIQSDLGKAKNYQVKQVLEAIDKMDTVDWR